MTALRIITLAAWLVVGGMMVPALLALVRGEPRERDPSRVIIFGFALVSASFNARWLAFPDSQFVWAALYVFSTLVAIAAGLFSYLSGRGEHE